MMNQVISIAVVLGLGSVFMIIALVVSHNIRPHRPTDAEDATHVLERDWSRYYIYALLFVLFDAAVALLYPWAVICRRIVTFHRLLFVDAVVFLAILAFALLYIWMPRAVWKLLLSVGLLSLLTVSVICLYLHPVDKAQQIDLVPKSGVVQQHWDIHESPTGFMSIKKK